MTPVVAGFQPEKGEMLLKADHQMQQAWCIDTIW